MVDNRFHNLESTEELQWPAYVFQNALPFLSIRNASLVQVVKFRLWCVVEDGAHSSRNPSPISKV